MKTRGNLAERTAGRTFSALLEKLGEQIHLSRSQTQIASPSTSISHSNASPTVYQSQPDVDINNYSFGQRISNCSSCLEDELQSTSLHSQSSPSNISVQSTILEEYSAESYTYSSSDEYYSSSATYSYYSDSNDKDDPKTANQTSDSTYTDASLPRSILKRIIHENPQILAHLKQNLKPTPSFPNVPNRQQESPEYKFSITEMRKIKELGEDLVAAAQTALKEEARRQRETSSRLSRPKQRGEASASFSSHHRPADTTPRGTSKNLKRRRPAVVLEVPQLNKATATTVEAPACDSSTTSTDLSSQLADNMTDQHSLTKASTHEPSTSSEQLDDPLILSHVQRDYLRVPQPVIQEHSPHRLSIPGTTSTSNIVEQKVHNDIPGGSVTSIATPQELLASVALVGSIPDTHSIIDATSKQHAASQTSSTNSSKQRNGDSSMGLLGAGSRSKPLSSSALEISGELPEPASRLLMTKSSSSAPSQPVIDLTLTTTAPQPGNVSTSYRSKSLASLSQQLRTTRIQSDQVVKELKDKISTLELKLKDEKQRNASTSRELRNLRERKRILESQLKKQIEEKDLATWEAQKKALKMNMSLIRTISAMKADQSGSKAHRRYSHRQVPSHMLSRRDAEYSESTQPLFSADLPLVEIAPPAAKLSVSKEESIPPSVKLCNSIEQSTDVNEIVVSSHKKQVQSSRSNDLNKVFIDTCNKTIRAALADVYDPDSATLPILASTDPLALRIDTTPPPPLISADHETDSPVDRRKLLESDISPEVTIDRLRPQDTNDDDKSKQPYTVAVNTQLFRKDLHRNASMILGNRTNPGLEEKNLRPPIAPQQEHRARSIRRYGECVALFLSPSPTRCPADASEITKLIVSVSTDISAIPGISSNERQYMHDNLRLVRELIESPDLSVFSYPLLSAKLITAMFCAYGNASFSVYSAIIYRISDLLVAEIVSSTEVSGHSSLYEIEYRLYTNILNIIRGTSLITMGTATYASLQPGENSFQILASAFSGLSEFVVSANVFLEDTALYLVVSTSAEILFSTSLLRGTNLLSLSATPVVGRSTGENHHTDTSISQAEQKDLLAIITKAVVLLCNQMLSESNCDDDKSEARYYHNHTLCSIASLLYCVSVLLQCDELSVEDGALLTQLRRRITDTIPSLNLVPHAWSR